MRQADKAGKRRAPHVLGNAKPLRNGDRDGGILQVVRSLQRGPQRLALQHRGIDDLDVSDRALRSHRRSNAQSIGIAATKHGKLVRPLHGKQPGL